MRFDGLSGRRQCSELMMAEATEMLGGMDRTCRRWRDRCEVDGADRLRDQRIGQDSHCLFLPRFPPFRKCSC